MLAKAHRLSRSAFAAAFASGRRSHSPIGTVIYVSGPVFHGAVVVSKKVSKRAVLRNQLRRQVYGQLLTQLKQKGHTGTVIVLLKPTAAQLTRSERLDALRRLIEQVPKPAYNSSHV